jgi:aminopeptidase
MSDVVETMDGAALMRYAELIVGFGANVQPGQILTISSEPGKEELTRAIATAAYRAGAKFVDAQYFDLHIKRARLLHGREEDLAFVPSWYRERMLEIGRQGCARVALTGPAAPGLLDDVDPGRAGRDQLPFLRETVTVVNERTTNWTAVPAPTLPWARLVHPDLDDEAALAKLVEQVLHVCRLDEEDPIASWAARSQTLSDTAARLTDRRFSAVRFTGPGTDLRVGLLPTSRFIAARFETVDGIVHMPNLPSEEIFSAPDPERVDGVVRATKPLVVGGSIVRGLEVEFSGGRAVRIDAEENAEVLRAYAVRDEGASRLGEIALVDGEGRIGPLDTVFFDTLLDENAASHVALGGAYAFTAGDEDRERINRSEIHVDFMIGGPEVEVDGETESGGRVAVLRRGAWQL